MVTNSPFRETKSERTTEKKQGTANNGINNKKKHLYIYMYTTCTRYRRKKKKLIERAVQKRNSTNMEGTL